MRNRLTEELAVCGFNAVRALAEVHSERVNRLFLRKERVRDFSRLCKYLAAEKRPYKICGDEELERLCKSAHHQGVVAMMAAPSAEAASGEDLDRWTEAGEAVLVLCGLTNDHNFGAIVRSAAFFDVKTLVTDNPLLTTSAWRVAEGGMEHITVRTVQDAAAFLRAAGSAGNLVCGTSPRARLHASVLPSLLTEKRQKALLSGKNASLFLVLGNEEEGLPEKVLASCEKVVRIPGSGLVESLSVSAACAVILSGLF